MDTQRKDLHNNVAAAPTASRGTYITGNAIPTRTTPNQTTSSAGGGTGFGGTQSSVPQLTPFSNILAANRAAQSGGGSTTAFGGTQAGAPGLSDAWTQALTAASTMNRK
ncbi:uncharacterized protein [Amphiura filiformis]|uniref:uncharacterized protein n=1 Tax=Amphiura filiformis TaxID=82378 RepID=UPI003B21E8DA